MDDLQLALLHFLHFGFQFMNCISVAIALILDTVQFLHCLFQLLFKCKIVTEDVAYCLLGRRLIELKFVEQLSSFTVKQTFTLQVLLVVVYFELCLLQLILFAVKIAFKNCHFFLDDIVLSVFLVLHLLHNLRQDKTLGIGLLNIMLQFAVSLLQQLNLPLELTAQLRFQRSGRRRITVISLLSQNSGHHILVDFNSLLKVLHFIAQVIVFLSKKLKLKVFMQQNVSLFNTHIGRLGRKHLLVVEGGASRA